MIRQDKAALCVGLAEVQAFARVETGEEEAMLASFLRVASELCETFLGQALMVRSFEQDMTLVCGWNLLGLQPVRSISSARTMSGEALLLGTEIRADIDHDGRGFVSGQYAGMRCTIVGEAGMAAEPNDIPEPIRQGIARLAAHLFANRDGPAGEMPAAVTTLWRPFRRTGLYR